MALFEFTFFVCGDEEIILLLLIFLLAGGAVFRDETVCFRFPLFCVYVLSFLLFCFLMLNKVAIFAILHYLRAII